MGLAGLQVVLGRGTNIAALKDEDAARAAQLAVWKLNQPPPWFERLLETHESAVLTALHPWIQAECASSSDATRIRLTLELALRCPSPGCARLLQPVVPLVLENRITNQVTLKALLDTLRNWRRGWPTRSAAMCTKSGLASRGGANAVACAP